MFLCIVVSTKKINVFHFSNSSRYILECFFLISIIFFFSINVFPFTPHTQPPKKVYNIKALHNSSTSASFFKFFTVLKACFCKKTSLYTIFVFHFALQEEWDSFVKIKNWKLLKRNTYVSCNCGSKSNIMNNNANIKHLFTFNQTFFSSLLIICKDFFIVQTDWVENRFLCLPTRSFFFCGKVLS